MHKHTLSFIRHYRMIPRRETALVLPKLIPALHPTNSLWQHVMLYDNYRLSLEKKIYKGLTVTICECPLLFLSQHFLSALPQFHNHAELLLLREGGPREKAHSPGERDDIAFLSVPVLADSGGISFPCNHCFPIIPVQCKLTSWQEISMNGCACNAALGMDSNRLKCSKIMTCMLSACATDYLHSWYSSCIHSTSGRPPPGQFHIDSLLTHSLQAQTNTKLEDVRAQTPSLPHCAVVLVESHTKVAEFLEAHVRVVTGYRKGA